MMQGRRVRFHEYEVDFVRRELRRGGVRLNLQHKPFRVLELLLRRPGELVTREELVEYLWPDSHVSFARGLNVAVNSLRHVLGESSRECHFIETRPGFGYSFIAPVMELSDESLSSEVDWQPASEADAYGDCLKGRYFLDRMAEEDVYKAIGCFKSAARDEAYRSLAQAGIADAYCQLAILSSVCPSHMAGQARLFAESALRDAPHLRAAKIAVGRVKMLFDWDWQGAQGLVRSALAVDSGSRSAQLLQAALLWHWGRYSEALEVCREVLAFDPLSLPAQLQLAACVYATGDFNGATNCCWEMLSLRSHFAPAQILLAQCHEQLGQYEEAAIEFQNARHCAGPHPAISSGLAHVFAAAGLLDQAAEACAELAAQTASRYVSPYWQAVALAARTQYSEALCQLEECCQLRDPAALWMRADARFKRFHSDPRWQAITNRMRTQEVSKCTAMAACG